MDIELIKTLGYPIASAVSMFSLFVYVFKWMMKFVERLHTENKQEIKELVNAFSNDTDMHKENINLLERDAMRELIAINQNITELKELAYKRDNHPCYLELQRNKV